MEDDFPFTWWQILLIFIVVLVIAFIMDASTTSNLVRP
jgi:hypothetical protein